jgi:hypothetical protein
MSQHLFSLADLADWVDGRLDVEALRQVEAHLETGCTTCQRDVAWLRRVIEAARSDDTIEPPAEIVARAKALYPSRPRQSAPSGWRLPQLSLPRIAWAAAALVLLGATLLTQIPTLLGGGATLTARQGKVEARSAGAVQWRELAPGERLSEGDQLRVADGAAVLALFDGSSLQIEPGSLLTLSSLRAGLLGGSRRVALQQQAGSVDYQVVPVAGMLSTFEAQSPTVRVVVHGTRFVITVESETQTRVSVLQGSVRLVNAVESMDLAEREVAVVSLDAPATRLPTLLPSPTLAATATTITAGTPVATPEPSVVMEPTEPTETTQPTLTLERRATEMVKPTRTLSAPLTATSTVTATVRPVPHVTAVPDIVQFEGPIERFPPRWVGVWRIGGRNVRVNRATRIIGSPALGLQASVTAVQQGPSSAASPLLLALQIEVEGPWPGPSPTPWVPKPTHTPRPTKTEEPSPTPRATRTPRPTDTPRPTATLRPTKTEEPTPTPRTTRTPRPTDTPRPTATLRPTKTEEPTPTPRATHTPRPTHTTRPTRTPRQTLTAQASEPPTPTHSPEPTATATPTATTGP